MFSQLYKKTYFPYLALALATLLSTVILWIPFILKTPAIHDIDTTTANFETVLKNWDGPLYIIPAKTNYDITNQILVDTPMGLEDGYFAAHLPLYPATLKLFAPFVGYPKSTVVSTLITSVLLVWFFYFFVSRLKLTQHPLKLSMVFLFFIPRFFVVRSVGSPEPLFLLLVLSSVYFFIKEKYYIAGLIGGLATMTKSPGILLFISYSLLFINNYLKTKKIRLDWLGILLIPGGLLVVFLIYHVQMGDFWAYFNSGDNLHLIFPPFAVFNYQKVWVDTGWLEDVMFIYFFYLYALLNLVPTSQPGLVSSAGLISAIQQSMSKLLHTGDGLENRIKQVFFAFTLVFFISIVCVQHRDISRYSLPILPFALIALERFFTSKKFLTAFILLLPAIYMYAWNFILYNAAPIADWTPFL